MFNRIHQLFLAMGKTLIFPLFLFSSFTNSQNLVKSWEIYSSIDVRVSKAIIHKDLLVLEQTTQQEGIRKLQKSSSWYNGWFNKMLLSRKSAEQLELADSIRSIHARIENLTRARQDIFTNLIKTYKDILLDSLARDNLTMIEKQNAFILVQWLKSRSNENISLPDYSHLINSNYEDIGIKNIVMKDMKVLLEQKIVLIDSLLDERRLENALVERLSEFHRDLGLQMEAELDISSSNRRLALDMATSGPDNEYTAHTGGFEYGADLVTNNEIRIGSSGFNPLLKSDDGYQEGFDKSVSLGDVVNLESKRHQYQELLKRIDKELNY